MRRGEDGLGHVVTDRLILAYRYYYISRRYQAQNLHDKRVGFFGLLNGVLTGAARKRARNNDFYAASTNVCMVNFLY
jgi:hypothetical protein